MPRRFFWFVVSLGLVTTVAAAAATVVNRSVSIDIGADGAVRERERIVIQIEDATDASDWSPFPVPLDENRRLVSLTASTIDPRGKSKRVPKRLIDTMEHAGSSELHSSRYLRLVHFPNVASGSRLVVEWEVEERPYFPSGLLNLGTRAAVDRARVEIRGPDSLRWVVAGRGDLVREEEIPGGVAFVSERVPRRTAAELGLEPAESGPVILWSWGPASTWADVGSWYRDLSFPVLGVEAKIGEVSKREIGSAETPRDALEALVRFSRRDVRYVAVEVGIGGYRPSPPGETLARRWGDCKDKSFLLIDLLRDRGIVAYPALLRAGSDLPLDPDFASPAWFDHLIVAIPTAGFEVREGDPTSGGYLFVDPTQTEGSASWLHPAVQGRSALVVTGDDAELVRTPVVPAAEASILGLDLIVDDRGSASGRFAATLSGTSASALRSFLRRRDRGRGTAELRGLFERWLPGASIEGLSWTETELPIPRVVVDGELAIPRFLHRTRQGAAIDLPAPPTTAAPGAFGDRPDGWVLEPAFVRREWRLDLEATGCRAEPSRVEEENPAGRFTATVAEEAGRLVVRRETVIRDVWVEPGQGGPMHALSLLEHQTAKRRLRLACDSPGTQ